MGKMYRFTYKEEVTHQVTAYAETEEEAKKKVLNYEAEADVEIDSEVDHKTLKLIESWEE